MPGVLRRRLYVARKPPVGARVNWGHPLAGGLVGAWLFNDGSRTPRELTAGLVTTLVGAPTYAAGPLGPAMRFTRATPDYTVTTDNRLNCSNGWTIVVACRPQVAFTNYENIIARGAGGAVQYGMILFNDGTWWAQGHGGNLTGTVLTLNQDVVLAATLDSASAAALYVNGVQVASVGAGYLVLQSQTGVALNWANDADDARPFDGLIYYGYIYNRALSAAALQQLYRTPYAMLIPPEPHLQVALMGSGAPVDPFPAAYQRAIWPIVRRW